MKKTFLTLLAIATSVSLFAQQPAKDDTPTLLKKADEAVKKSDYRNALMYLNQAKSEVNRLLGEQYLSVLPAKYGDYTAAASPSSTASVSGSNSGSTQTYTRSYTKSATGAPATNTPPTPPTPPAGGRGGAVAMGLSMSNGLTATINMSVSAIGSIITAHQPTEDAPKAPTAYDQVPVKVKGYKATQLYNADSKQGSLSVLVGSAVIEVRGSGIDNIEVLTKFFDLVDVAKLKTLNGDQ